MPQTPLLTLGPVPADGRDAGAWEAFTALAPDADALAVHADAVPPDALASWLRETARRPPTVVVLPDAERERALLEAGADEVAIAPDAEALKGAMDRARSRAIARGRTERFRLMIENTRDIVSVVDGFARFVYASPSVREILGHDPEDLLGTNAFEHVHPDDVTPTMETFLEAIGTPGSTRALSYRYRTADGDHRHLEGVGRTFVGADGEPFAIINARDVTERVRAEGSLRQSEARYRSLLGALPDVISRIRRDGLVLDFHVPPVFATEFPAEALLGKRLQDEIPADLAEGFVRAVAQVDDAPGPVTYRYAVDSADGRFYREARIVPHGADEVLSILRDVTPEAEAELGLRASKAELEASQAELRALAAHLQEVREEERAHLSREVHDTLGQQLTAIRYALGWFGRQVDGPEAEERLADARALVDDTISRVRQIAADLRPGVLDDFGLATALEWYAERVERRTGLVVAVQTSGDAETVPDEIATASFRIAQEALTNVARHARAETVRVSLTVGPDAVRLRVEDDGVGLDPATLDGRRSLGVLGMRERARAQGGALSFEGAPGEGAAVAVTFPLPTPDSPA